MLSPSVAIALFEAAFNIEKSSIHSREALSFAL